MATGPRYSVPFKRKREEKTNYRKRLALLKSNKPRLVIRRTNMRIIAQIIDFNPIGDKTVLSVSNKNLKEYGFPSAVNNTTSAYLTGYLLGKLALKNKIKEAVFDMGLGISSKGNRLYSALSGVVGAGLRVPHDAKMFPSNERLKGAHVKGFDINIFESVKKKIEEKVK